MGCCTKTIETFLIFLAYHSLLAAAGGGQSKTTNFLVILADDLGYNDIGYTNPDVITPNLNRLAEEGVTLTQAYASLACSPSRAALLTSYYPHRLRASHNVLLDLNPTCVPLDVDLLPERLKRQGYTTSLLGKWHMGFCREECLPTSRGFDHFYGAWTGAVDYNTHKAGFGKMLGHDWRNGTVTDRTVDGEFNTDVITRIAGKLLEQHADNKDHFFMVLSYFNPHQPLQVAKNYQDMYKGKTGWGEDREKYLGLVTNLDDHMGVIEQKLKDTGLYDNTLILFASDNGGTNGGFADNSPYRGGKCSLWEGGSRVPMFFHGPMLKKTGYNHDGMFHFIDIGATFVAMAGGEMQNTDGFDQTDMILEGGPSKRDTLVYQLDQTANQVCGQAGYRHNDMKIIWGPFGFSDGYGKDVIEYWRDPEFLALVNLTQTLKPGEGYYDGYVVNFTLVDLNAIALLAKLWEFDPDDINSGVVYLYNLTADPGETTNLAENAEHADLVLDMKREILEKLRTEYNAPTAEMMSFRMAGAPFNFGGVMETGWCPDDTFTVNIPGASAGNVAKFDLLALLISAAFLQICWSLEADNLL